MRRYGRLAVTLLVVAVSSTVGSAGAQAGWIPGVSSGSTLIAGVGGVVSDPSGATTVTWVEATPGGDSGALRVQRVAADGTPGPVRTLGTLPSDETVDQAITPTGTTVIAWPSKVDDNTIRVKLTTVPPDGSVGATRDVSEDEGRLSGSVRVGVDDAGNALVIWGVQDPFDGMSLHRRRMPAVGAPGPDTVLASELDVQAHPQIAVDPAGNAYVGWSVPRPAGGDDHGLQLARLNAQGALVGSVEDIAATSSQGLSLAASAGGAVATWVVGPGANGSYTVRGARMSPVGPLNAMPIVAEGLASWTSSPNPTIGPDGTVTVVWSHSRSFLDAPLRFRRFLPNGSSSAAQDLGTGQAGQLEAFPKAVTAPDGTVFVAWVSMNSQAENLSLWTRRIGPGGDLGPSTSLGVASPAWAQPERSISLAVDGVGGAVLGWYLPSAAGNPLEPASGFTTAVYDGTPPASTPRFPPRSGSVSRRRCTPRRTIATGSRRTTGTSGTGAARRRRRRSTPTDGPGRIRWS